MHHTPSLEKYGDQLPIIKIIGGSGENVRPIVGDLQCLWIGLPCLSGIGCSSWLDNFGT